MFLLVILVLIELSSELSYITFLLFSRKLIRFLAGDFCLVAY